MDNTLENVYEDEYRVLQNLYGKEKVNERIKRLNQIYNYTEDIWEKYIKNIPGGTVKYLFIAESPPWSPTSAPQYFLDPKSRSRTLMRELRKAFFPNCTNENSESILKMFSKYGFLLIDSIPFSMDYLGKRNNRCYKELVNKTVHSYMLNKLKNSGLRFQMDMKIAFGYEINAITIINSLENNIVISGHNYRISSEMICTSGAHYPDADRIISIYSLNVA